MHVLPQIKSPDQFFYVFFLFVCSFFQTIMFPLVHSEVHNVHPMTSFTTYAGEQCGLFALLFSVLYIFFLILL